MNHSAPLPQRCLPGTEPPTRGLFVDRWGTLLELPSAPPKRFADTTFVAGAVDALYKAQCEGWSVYLVGNEDHVAHGEVSDQEWLHFEGELLGALAAQGVRPKRFYACLEHPAGKEPHKKPSVFRLPDTGLFYHALQADGVQLHQSWVVGDSSLEIAAGQRAGCKTAGLRSGLALRDRELAIEPDIVFDDLAKMVQTLVRSPAYARPR
ncbi:MAG: HAD hydrolase-like protein [Planctomycetes bacterium]|nr:HAD hydrolase-like protein [Planctomycetota bacterium]